MVPKLVDTEGKNTPSGAEVARTTPFQLRVFGRYLSPVQVLGMPKLSFWLLSVLLSPSCSLPLGIKVKAGAEIIREGWPSLVFCLRSPESQGGGAGRQAEGSISASPTTTSAPQS